MRDLMQVTFNGYTYSIYIENDLLLTSLSVVDLADETKSCLKNLYMSLQEEK